MKLQVRGEETFVSTGGRAFDPEGEVLLFIHGSGQNHLGWVLQGRFFANRGWQVLAPDLPGHHLSRGRPLGTITDMADWCSELLDAAGVTSATVIGHSQGGLVALEMGRRHAPRVKRMALVASALTIPVNPALLEMAKHQEARAISAMISWGHGRTGQFHAHTMPGQSHLNYGAQIMAANPGGALFTDLKACADYQGGESAAAQITQPVLCILAGRDRMTPIKSGRHMAAALNDAQVVVIEDGGHMLPNEQPFAVNHALRDFFPKP